MIIDMAIPTSSFGDRAVLAFSKHTEKIFKYQPRVLKDKDPEDLHQLRVGMRRLRTAIAGFGVAVHLPEGITERPVGKMAQVLGVQRDNDVLQTLLESKHRPHLPPKEQGFLDKIFRQLQKQRKQAFKATHKLLTKDKFAEFKDQWQDWLVRPQITSLGNLAIATVLPDLLLPQLSQFLLHPGWLVGMEINPGDNAQGLSTHAIKLSPTAIQTLLDGQGFILHDLRKEAKRTRYQMELFRDCYGQQYQQLLEQVKMVQEILGDLQDSFILRTMVENHSDGDLSQLCPEWDGLLQGDRLRCWAQWQPLQCQLIDPDYRHRCRQLLQNPFPCSKPNYENITDPDPTSVATTPAMGT